MDQCRRPIELEINDYKQTISMLEDANRQLLLRIDQLKWEKDRLATEVEKLALDLKMSEYQD